jgi:hypothetical protein
VDPNFINWENMDPVWYPRTVKNYEIAGQLDPNQSNIPVIVVRDLLNWWASYLKFVGSTAARNKQNVFNGWIGQVREAFGETRYIPGNIPIIYDQFFTVEDERRRICMRVGGGYNEDYIDYVPSPGNGSSFDGQTLPGREMQTLTRYKQMEGIPEFHQMLRQNPEAVYLYQKYFLLTEDQKNLIKALR